MRFTFCPLFSGSSGNSLFIGAGDTRILVDAGMPGRAIEAQLRALDVAPDTLSGILITHEHSDHIKGVGILSRKYDLPVYANEGTWMAMQDKIGGVALKNQRLFYTGEDFYIGELNVSPFSIPHDAAEPVGYAFHYGSVKAATATDIGHINEKWMSAVAGARVMMLESNHDMNLLISGPYPLQLKNRIKGRRGHLCNDDSARALVELCRAGLQNVILGHLSKENNLPELAFQTAYDALCAAGIRPGEDVTLEVARREQISGIYTLEA